MVEVFENRLLNKCTNAGFTIIDEWTTFSPTIARPLCVT
jgi:hypothetical protein